MSTFKRVIKWHVEENPVRSGKYLAFVEELPSDFQFLFLFFDSKSSTWRDLRIEPDSEATDEVPKELVHAWTNINELSSSADSIFRRISRKEHKDETGSI